MGVEGSKGESAAARGESMSAGAGGRGDLGFGGKARRDYGKESKPESVSTAFFDGQQPRSRKEREGDIELTFFPPSLFALSSFSLLFLSFSSRSALSLASSSAMRIFSRSPFLRYFLGAGPVEDEAEEDGTSDS